MKVLCLVVLEKKIFFMFSHDAPGARPIRTPGARFIKRTTMKALGLVVSEKKIFLCFSHCMSTGANDPRGGTIYDSRGMVGRIYKEDHNTLLHTKYNSSGPCGFGEVLFFFFTMTPQGLGLYGPKRHGWQDL